MKFAIASVAALLTVADPVSAANVSSMLRAGGAGAASGVSETTEGRISIGGLTSKLAGTDLDILSDSFMAAFDKAYGSSGHVDSFAPLATSDSYNNEDSKAAADVDEQMVLVRVGVTWTRDMSSASSLPVIRGMSDMHKRFEHELCSGLRQSGSATFAGAEGCEYAVLEKPGHTSAAMQSVAVMAASAGAAKEVQGEKAMSVEGQVRVGGLLDHDLTRAEVQLLSKSVVDAYNEAYERAGFRMVDFAATSSSATIIRKWYGWNFAPDCRLCPPMMQKMDGMMKNALVVTATVTPGNGVGSGNKKEKALTSEQYAYMTAAFEKAMCAKLQNSGLAKFANAHDCSFAYVNSPSVAAAAIAADLTTQV